MMRVLCLLSLIFGVGQALAQTQTGVPVLKVMVNPFPVYSRVDRNGNIQGLAAELAKNVAEHAGMNAVFEAVPFARLMSTMKRGAPVLGTVVVRTPKREEDFYWIMPISADPNALFVLDEQGAAGSKVSPSDVSSVAVLRDDFREAILHQAGVTDVMLVNTWGQAIDAVLRGRVDGLLFSQMGLSVVCQNEHKNCSDLKQVKQWGDSISYLVLPKNPKNKALADRLKQGAQAFQQSPTYRQVMQDAVDVFSDFGIETAVENDIIHIKGELAAHQNDDVWVLAEISGGLAVADNAEYITGYNPAVVRAILLEAGLEQTILPVPWSRILKELRQNANVIAFSVARTESREQKYHWITPLTRNRYGLFGRDPVHYEQLTDVPKNQRIAVLKEDFRGDISRQAGLMTLEFDNWRQATIALYGGNVDYLFTSASGVDITCRKMKIACNDITLAVEHDVKDTWLVVSKNGTSPVLVKRLRDAANRVKNSSNFTQWAENWLIRTNQENHTDYVVKDGIIYLYNPSKSNP